MAVVFIFVIPYGVDNEQSFKRPEAALHLNSPRMASRECRAWKGVLARRSRPAVIVSDVILAIECCPALAITCRKIFSRWRLVASDKLVHADVSR